MPNSVSHKNSPLPSQSIEEILSQVTYLKGLDAEIYAAVAQVASRRRLISGNVIFWEGDACAGLYMVESGTIKVLRMSKDGREQIVHMIHPGETFNDVAALDGGPNPATTIALTDAVVWCVPRIELERIVHRYPPLAWALIGTMAKRTRQLLGLVEDLSLRSVKSRLAQLLLRQAQANESDDVPRLLTQEEMASRLGTVREMVGRSLRSLATDGVIEFDRHRIVILDADRLAEEADV
ncbi:MAG: Crp/Fnr family transcriptional regulator [Caldilineaceae bacterium]|nr:Crp/Fnr family transcriptional regulator [Caldilineaceae bacterium]MBP8109549.1 Crp/Fnr family transcriptional regulator [Caldilineaceae bacterium]MBP8121891.1 Crp/Fnr family transcriptional regulator [Caldilineaceae bacterium]MBP9073144.1 Crp/Fnr family transcriptional regulator [Caldilineaceae bacterium]